MDKFRRSWALFRSSLAVMMQNKTLLAFPILISAVSVFIVILFATPIAFQPTGHSYLSSEHWEAVGKSLVNYQSHDVTESSDPATPGGPRNFNHHTDWSYNVQFFRPITLGYFALLYFVSMFVATFLNVAFYREIMNALNGQPVSILAGIRFAATKWKIILMWTLFAGLVGFIIKTLEERFGWIGEIIMRIIGTVWSVACVFVIPVIITEEETANPFVVLKKSALTLKKTWGESLIGYSGVSLGSSLVVLMSLLWLGGGIAGAVALQSIWLGAAVVVAWLAGIIVWSYLMGVASQIFRCALFLYASQGTMPGPYTDEMMSLAWKTKKS